MATTIKIDPVTRIEGHLEIEVTVDAVNGQQQVVSARSAGVMFRGFEQILIGRDPRDAGLYTQRICGVCPVSHAQAACLSLDRAFGVSVPDNGRILRNLVAGANFLDSHILHFYQLSVLDYVAATAPLNVPPWTPRYDAPDLLGGSAAEALAQHYVTALHVRRKAHQAGALFGGKLPMVGSFVVGGCTHAATAAQIVEFRGLLSDIRTFIDGTYVPDAELLAAQFPAYYAVGGGAGNLLAYGAFELNGAGTSKLFGAGRIVGGELMMPFDAGQIAEQVAHSWFTPACGNLHPAQGQTVPDADKPGAYSWGKAPRYDGQAYEMGPLARMWINGEYTHGISTMDRIVARAREAQKLANAMDGWLDQLVPGAPSYVPAAIPANATSAGLTEAPRGGLGHWMQISNSAISRYQVITPTSWNASPRDDQDQPGPLEAALVGTPVADVEAPLEVLRVVHSFDPCLACSVHLVRPGRRAGVRVLVRPSPV